MLFHERICFILFGTISRVLIVSPSLSLSDERRRERESERTISPSHLSDDEKRLRVVVLAADRAGSMFISIRC